MSLIGSLLQKVFTEETALLFCLSGTLTYPLFASINCHIILSVDTTNNHAGVEKLVLTREAQSTFGPIITARFRLIIQLHPWITIPLIHKLTGYVVASTHIGLFILEMNKL